MSRDRIIKQVWENGGRPYRYVPMNNDGGAGTGWDVWDRQERKWVVGKSLAGVDASELFFTDMNEEPPPPRVSP